METVGLLLACLFLFPAPAWNQEAATNVPYTTVVEGVEVPSRLETRLSGDLRRELQLLVGMAYEEARVESLLWRLKEELQDYRLAVRTAAGSLPGRIRVVFEALVAEAAADPTNVNSRYMVEAVELPVPYQQRLSDALRAELKAMVGRQFNPQQSDRLLRRLREELEGYRITQRVVRGSKPDSIRIVYEVERTRRRSDVVLPRLAYHSKQNFTFGGDVKLASESFDLQAGILTDHNDRVERYSGLRASLFRRLVDDRLRLGFVAESWRSQWNPAVEESLRRLSAGDGDRRQGEESVPGIYRKRQAFSPGLEVVIGAVTLAAGISLQRFQTQFPAARYETAHTLNSSLRLEQRWQLPGFGTQALNAGYHLRAATSFLGSDFTYTRHALEASYQLERGRETITAAFTAGFLNGRAPLFERFVLGNLNTLRGWNKFDIAPLGGSRIAHGSLDYRKGWFRMVYDVGALQGPASVSVDGEPGKVRHSLAAGLTTGPKREAFSVLLAFPIRDGRIEPIWIIGMNF
ncbi:MAG: outer membrane protein assembly factor [Bryobacteraceae bacterium]|nr:outer membrane protein assembly factor [Bryobacteraceae bacterium]MDW8377888.1 BamA/TamA family outer membrane protein [Bryobacterales bacterium]